MLTQEQMNNRAQGIGASECAAVMGIDPYCTPYELWMLKTGRMVKDLSGNEAIIMGNLLEPVIAYRYEQLTGQKIRRVNTTYHHKDFHPMLCHLDRKIVGKKKSVEIKTANPFSSAWGNTGTDEVPAHYLAQVQHQLSVTGFEESDLIVFRGTTDLRLYNFKPDLDLIEVINDKVRHFWKHHVLKDIPPEPSTRGDLKLIYPDSNGNLIQTNSFVKDLMEHLSETKKHINRLEKEKSMIEKEIIQFIASNDGIKDGDDVIATFKASKNGTRTLRIKERN